MSDWFDGKLAMLLNQRSVWGPRLDSWADLMLYTALFFGTLVLQGATLQDEWLLITLALISYTISTLAGLWKYHRWPSYHTRTAKLSWLLILIGAVCLLVNLSLWPLRIALFAIVISNIETIAITHLSPKWRDDAGSIFQVLRDKTDH
jgi:CDP-diacylglycerol--glycerol-3-phosphate 3-phosphatidyltransferase